MITWGLDTSHWEGTQIPIINKIIAKTGKVNHQHETAIDFHQVARAGAKFVLIKATEGIDNVDDVWEDSANDAHAEDMVVFPFHFYREVDATDQLHWFTDNIAGRFDGVPMVDFEITPKNRSAVLFSLVAIGQGLRAMYHTIPLLYTSPNYLAMFGSLDITPLLTYNLALATWNNGFTANCYPWAGYLVRQYTAKGKIPGIKASVDLDYMLDDPKTIVRLSEI
jgi:lysozyme